MTTSTLSFPSISNHMRKIFVDALTIQLDNTVFEARIVGGKNVTTPGQWPWQVLLDSGSGFCGGIKNYTTNKNDRFRHNNRTSVGANCSTLLAVSDQSKLISCAPPFLAM